MANELTVMNNFNLMLNNTTEIDPDLMDELEDIGEDLTPDVVRIKIPSGGGTAFEVLRSEDDSDMEKEITGVIVYTHKSNTHWAGKYGEGSDEDNTPLCSSNDGKFGFNRLSGEMVSCDGCPFNEFGADGGAKECKNTRNLYIMRPDDEQLYLLNVPAGSLRIANVWLTKTAKRGVSYSSVAVKFSLKKAESRAGIKYAQLVMETVGQLDPASATAASEMRKALKAQLQRTREVKMDDVQSAPENYTPDNSEDQLPW